MTQDLVEEPSAFWPATSLTSVLFPFWSVVKVPREGAQGHPF